ncbi:Segregation and condensation protein A [BD1-7 clade bacterium]|uniref:Segregation and condensation protein A n=1 Tax=BD1-7 clade bacterium TaxID=2029982 RepID=A0A5S9QKB5_9GAMM|nr:Segregation and condensation protein A [BD1-7 clade bacterium]
MTSDQDDINSTVIAPVVQHQEELPLAIVDGKPFTDVPKDLYIPPSALQVFLETFEGPLDLLLYLIKRQNIDILEIDVFSITSQYVAYVEMMDAMHFELAAEYLVMAAMLAEIKSRMLLPRTHIDEDEDEDPRAALIRRLQQYERFKKAAEDIGELPRVGRELHVIKAAPPEIVSGPAHPDIDLTELLLAFGGIIKRAELHENHQIEFEALSTRERMADVLDKLQGQQFMPFVALFVPGEGRLGVVVTFLAILELSKESLIDIVQTEPCGPIHVKARA